MKYVILPLFLMLFACAGTEPVVQPEDVEPPKPDPTCHDGMLNQDEDQIDCGGSCKACASCEDGILNQGEEKIDCGGPCETACPTCFDKVKNQKEVEVDCGGPCQPCQIDYEIKADDATGLKTKLKPNVEATFLSNSYPSGLLIGESRVFAMGITNTMSIPYDFQFVVEFKEARDSKTNLIEDADSTTVMKWFSDNEWEGDYSLDKYEQAFIPVGVTVGEFMAAGKETQKGTYYFSVDVTYRKGTGTLVDHKELEFSFKVI